MDTIVRRLPNFRRTKFPTRTYHLLVAGREFLPPPLSSDTLFPDGNLEDLVGLILEPVGDKPNEYRRVGAFSHPWSPKGTHLKNKKKRRTFPRVCGFRAKQLRKDSGHNSLIASKLPFTFNIEMPHLDYGVLHCALTAEEVILNPVLQSGSWIPMRSHATWSQHVSRHIK